MMGLFAYVEGLVLGACLLTIAYVAAAGALRTRHISSGVVTAGISLVWFLLIFQMARLGMFEGGSAGARRAQAGVMIVPLLIGLIVAWRLGRAAITATLPVPGLVGIQTYRLASITLLIAVAKEALPPWLGLPIALGDLAVGLSAPLLARALKENPRGYAIITRSWNWLGMVTAALAMLATTATGNDAGYFLTLYPLVLIPTYLAPVSILLHALTLTEIER
jgi:hypothetical protein